MSIKKKWIGSNEVDASKILFLNDTTLKSKSADGQSDLSLLKLDGSDVVQLLRKTQISAEPSDGSDLTNKIYVDSQVASESSRAAAAEQSLADAIAFITSNVDPEAIDSLVEVVQAFQAADSSLQGAITALSGAAGGNLDAEISRAQAAEASLEQALLDEVSRAGAAEASLEQALLDEVSRAGAAEASLEQALLDEVSRAEAAEASLTQSLATRALDNLENVAINASLVPDMGMAYDLGSDMNTWTTVHADAVQLGSGIKTSMSQTVLDMSQAGMGVVTLQDPGANYKVELSNGVSLLSDASTGFKIGNGSGISPIGSTEVLGSLYSDGLTSSLGMSNGAGFEGAYLTNLYANDGADAVASFSSTMESKLKAGATDALTWSSLGVTVAGPSGIAIDIDYSNAGVFDLQRNLESVSHVDVGSETHYFNAGHFQRVYGGRDVMSLEPLAPVDTHELVNKAYVDGIDTSLSAAITDEQSRAEAAEASLAGALETETSRALAAEESLATAIAFIVSNVDSAALDSLTEVVAAFQAADSSLQGAITALSGAAGGNLDAEISRAQAAEASLEQALLDEVSRAGAAEASLEQALLDEVSRAGAAEASLEQALLDEISRAQAVETSISTAIGAMMVEVGVYETKTLSAGDISNQYVDVGHTIVGQPVISIDRIMLMPNVDFTVSGSRISFIGPIATGGAEALVENDVLAVWYNKSINGF